MTSFALNDQLLLLDQLLAFIADWQKELDAMIADNKDILNFPETKICKTG